MLRHLNLGRVGQTLEISVTVIGFRLGTTPGSYRRGYLVNGSVVATGAAIKSNTIDVGPAVSAVKTRAFLREDRPLVRSREPSESRLAVEAMLWLQDSPWSKAGPTSLIIANKQRAVDLVRQNEDLSREHQQPARGKGTRFYLIPNPSPLGLDWPGV